MFPRTFFLRPLLSQALKRPPILTPSLRDKAPPSRQASRFAFRQQCHVLARFSAWVVLLAVMAPGAFAAFNNVTVANVTASGFSVLWQGSGNPGIEVFADNAGTSNLAGMVSVDFYPLHSGNTQTRNSYERRQHTMAARANGRSLGLSYLRVGNCRPDTTYYVRLTSSVGSTVEVHPPTGLLSVRTPAQTSFIRGGGQLIIDVPGLNNDGRLLTLTHPLSAYALAAVVGDGAGTNQAFFSVSDLLNLAGNENFSATGSQEFEVDLWGTGPAPITQEFTLVLGNAFQIAQAVHQGFGLEFGALSLGSGIVRTGQTGSIPILLNTSATVSNITAELLLPMDRLANLALSNRAPAIGTVTITSNSPTSALLSIRAAAGQALSGQMALGDLSFTVVANQSSAFANLRWAQPRLIKSDSTGVSNVVAQAGRIVILGAEPLLEAFADAAGKRRLIMYGNPWSSYGVEYSSAMGQNANWQLLTQFPLTNQFITLNTLQSDTGTWFYRAYEFKADPPLVRAQRRADGSPRLLVYGQPGVQYTVLAKTNLSSAVAWMPVMNYTLTNSFTYLEGFSNSFNAVFYQLQKE